MADAMFAQTVPVPGRRVEVTDTTAPCGLKHFLRIIFLDPLEQLTKGRSAKTQRRQLDSSMSERSQSDRHHSRFLQ